MIRDTKIASHAAFQVDSPLAIASLESAIGDSRDDLPEEIFLFVSRRSRVNDLLIPDDRVNRAAAGIAMRAKPVER